MRKDIVRVCIAAMCCLLALTAGCARQQPKEYGVFLGINGEQAERMKEYRLVVIEPSEFDAEEIRALKAEGKTVYGYLNIGAIEEYREYYSRFRGITLGVYEDWPEERWVDVSSSDWQNFLVHELGKKYVDLGLDGFFPDNADVYDVQKSEESFQGLCRILEGLKTYGIPFVLNGGDVFVSRCIDEGSARSLFDGINQETVFTRIDFERKTYGRQSAEEQSYFKGYLAKAKACGLSVALLEYGADRELEKEIAAYCRENGFLWYNAADLRLT